MPKATHKASKPDDSGRGLSLAMDFDEAMRRAVRVKPEKKPTKRKK